MMTAMNIIGNPDSELFPNQTIDGRDNELYPKIEPDHPRKYHDNLRDKDMRHIYPDLFDEEEETEEDENVRLVI